MLQKIQKFILKPQSPVTKIKRQRIQDFVFRSNPKQVNQRIKTLFKFNGFDLALTHIEAARKENKISFSKLMNLRGNSYLYKAFENLKALVDSHTEDIWEAFQRTTLDNKITIATFLKRGLRDFEIYYKDNSSDEYWSRLKQDLFDHMKVAEFGLIEKVNSIDKELSSQEFSESSERKEQLLKELLETYLKIVRLSPDPSTDILQYLALTAYEYADLASQNNSLTAREIDSLFKLSLKHFEKYRDKFSTENNANNTDYDFLYYCLKESFLPQSQKDVAYGYFSQAIQVNRKKANSLAKTLELLSYSIISNPYFYPAIAARAFNRYELASNLYKNGFDEKTVIEICKSSYDDAQKALKMLPPNDQENNPLMNGCNRLIELYRKFSISIIFDQYLKKEDFEKAVEMSRELTKLYPENLEARYILMGSILCLLSQRQKNSMQTNRLIKELEENLLVYNGSSSKENNLPSRELELDRDHQLLSNQVNQLFVPLFNFYVIGEIKDFFLNYLEVDLPINIDLK
ncbi:MAG: hypothetical protein QNJ31_06650 [Candidatus Caenarcaniphilales bacterium]|nr:hypothetical protein [Candidatus Caenarcaniphilales bacterium]